VRLLVFIVYIYIKDKTDIIYQYFCRKLEGRHGGETPFIHGN
jgi:hypothetical protein